MITQEQRDKVWLDRRERLKNFVANSPKMNIEITKALGPYRIGDTDEVTCATGRDYINRGFAKEI